MNARYGPTPHSPKLSSTVGRMMVCKMTAKMLIVKSRALRWAEADTRGVMICAARGRGRFAAHG